MKTLLFCLIFYLIGSIPFGCIFSKIRGKDIRKTGSGNTGAANVYRNLGFFLGFSTFVADFLKAYIPLRVYLLFYPFNNRVYYFAMCILIGHCFSIFIKLHGGKGISTSAGILGLFSLYYLIPFMISYISLVSIFRISSLASIVSLLLSLVFIWVLPVESYDISLNIFIFFVIINAFVLFMHRKNIKRIFNKNELQI